MLSGRKSRLTYRRRCRRPQSGRRCPCPRPSLPRAPPSPTPANRRIFRKARWASARWLGEEGIGEGADGRTESGTGWYPNLERSLFPRCTLVRPLIPAMYPQKRALSLWVELLASKDRIPFLCIRLGAAARYSLGLLSLLAFQTASSRSIMAHWRTLHQPILTLGQEAPLHFSTF